MFDRDRIYREPDIGRLCAHGVARLIDADLYHVVVT